jgi:hypothetical protein
LQYPDPITATDFLVEALDHLALSQKSPVHWRKNRGGELTAHQPPPTLPQPDPSQPVLYSTPESSMPEAWRVLFFVSAVCATRGQALEARESPDSARLLVRYIAYLLYLTMRKSPDDRVLVWGSLLMSYTPTEIQNLISNTNSSFRNRKQRYLALVRQRFSVQTRTADRHTILEGHPATDMEVHLIETMAREFCSWLSLFTPLPQPPGCPLFTDIQLNVGVFADLALHEQRAQQKAELRQRTAAEAEAEAEAGGAPPTGRALDRLVDIALQVPLFEPMRHVVACPDCQGFARLVAEWRAMLTPRKGREQFETAQHKKERHRWETDAMAPHNKIIVPQFGPPSEADGTSTNGRTRRKSVVLSSPPSLTASDWERIQTLLREHQQRRTAFVASGPLQVLVNGKVRAQLQPGAAVVVELTESDEYLEVRGRDRQGDVRLATALLPEWHDLLAAGVPPRIRIEWGARPGSDAQTTSAPPRHAAAPTLAPISPGCSTPTVTCAM